MALLISQEAIKVVVGQLSTEKTTDMQGENPDQGKNTDQTPPTKKGNV